MNSRDAFLRRVLVVCTGLAAIVATLYLLYFFVALSCKGMGKCSDFILDRSYDSYFISH